MKKLLFFLIVICGLFYIKLQMVKAATCEVIVWNQPINKGGGVFTLSGTIQNCTGSINTRLEVNVRQQTPSDPLIDIDPIRKTVTNGAFSGDVLIAGTEARNIYLTLYNESATDAVIVNPDCSTSPPAEQNNSRCNWRFYATVDPSAPAAGGGTTTPGNGNVCLNTSGPITCNVTFCWEGDPNLIVCPSECPNHVFLQAQNQYQCSDQNLSDTPLEAADFQIVLKPKADIKDTYIINKTYARYLGEAETGPGGSGSGPINTSTTDFDELMRGQGRNISLYPNASAFADAAIKNIGNRFTNQASSTTRDANTYKPYLEELYTASVAKNVNPVIILTIWGVEESFVYNTHSFNCPPPREGWGQTYSEQLGCSIASLNNLMRDYENRAAKGENPVTIPKANGAGSCNYTDPFLYAYEMYTPVCHTSDQNDNAHTNFVIIFREILGLTS